MLRSPSGYWQTKVLRREDPYLKVEQCDVVGIIGRNGAGKSTLLKLLSRVTVTSAKDFLLGVSPAGRGRAVAV